jgi:hypothetical protein
MSTELDVITTDTHILCGQRRLRIYRWQTKGLMTAMSIWTRYYLPKPRDNGARPGPSLPDRD